MNISGSAQGARQANLARSIHHVEQAMEAIKPRAAGFLRRPFANQADAAGSIRIARYHLPDGDDLAPARNALNGAHKLLYDDHPEMAKRWWQYPAELSIQEQVYQRCAEALGHLRPPTSA